MFDTFKGGMGCGMGAVENWIRRSCGAKIRFGSRATGKLASNACAKPATTCKQLHEMSVAASPVGDVDA